MGREPTGISYPSPAYYTALEIYRTGELDRAIDAFEFAIGRSRKSINGYWIDAIPAHAMLAECQYHLGDLEGAMYNLDMDLKIAIRYRGWLSRPVWTEVLMAQVKYSPKQYLWKQANAVNRLATTRAIKGAVFDEVVARFGVMTICCGILGVRRRSVSSAFDGRSPMGRRIWIANGIQAIFFTGLGWTSLHFFGVSPSLQYWFIASLVASFGIHLLLGTIYARYGLIAAMLFHLGLGLKFIVHGALEPKPTKAVSTMVLITR